MFSRSTPFSDTRGIAFSRQKPATDTPAPCEIAIRFFTLGRLRCRWLRHCVSWRNETPVLSLNCCVCARHRCRQRAPRNRAQLVQFVLCRDRYGILRFRSVYLVATQRRWLAQKRSNQPWPEL